MKYILIILFLAIAAGLFLYASIYCERLQSLLGGDTPSDDRQYWAQMVSRFKKSAYIAAAGALLAAISLALLRPVPAEIGCITLLAAVVYALAILCRKTTFHPAMQTETLQKRGKLILLIGSILCLTITQMVFQFFLSIEG